MAGLLLQGGISTAQIAQEAITESSVAASVGNLAGGIGGIFLLFVLFYYVTSILDGGKFQVKMLMPVLIYILACNFSWVTGPVTGFTTAITGALTQSFNARAEGEILSHGGKPGDSIFDLYNQRRRDELKNNPSKKEVEDDISELFQEESAILGSGEGNTGSGSQGSTDSDKRRLINWTKVSQNLTNALNNWVRTLFANWAAVFSFSSLKDDINDMAIQVKYSIMGLITAFLTWVSRLLSRVLNILGGTMTGIIMALGPLTWAFAVFPGRGKTIETWFIRLCQFALWSPIAALIAYLNTKLSLDVADALGSGGDGMFSLCVSLVGNIIALTAVPSIAQMVLEGASGSISLTGGLQMAAHAVTTSAAIAASPVTGALGANRYIKEMQNAKANKEQLANDKTFNSSMINRLDQIIQGQNTKKSSSSGSY